MYTLAAIVAMRARSFRTEVLQDDARFSAFFKLSHYPREPRVASSRVSGYSESAGVANLPARHFGHETLEITVGSSRSLVAGVCQSADGQSG